MSFIDSIVGFGKKVFGGNSIGSSLARTALLGYALNRVSKNIAKANQPKDRGSQIAIDPDTEFSVPVLYGTAFVSGRITDAVMAANNFEMWVCVTLCEKTGNLIDGTPSAISFEEMYIDNMRIGFRSDGVTVETIWDDSGNSSNQWDGLISVYPFNGGSTSPTTFTTESTGNSANAYDIMPNWSSTDTMNDLVFCIIRFRYSSEQTKKLTSIGRDIKFKLSNTMTQPGDCMNDYLQNARYGAGISSAEIDIQ
jgi:hypothetical protein